LWCGDHNTPKTASLAYHQKAGKPDLGLSVGTR
jgi:hypothetical protein